MPTLAMAALALLGLALVIAARTIDTGHAMALAGVACWIVAFGVMLGHAGPRRRKGRLKGRW
jgi:hypothetical protein